jgi:hypothetical protein
MSQLDAFEAEVRKNIKLLSSEDAAVRRKAATWLGEAGEPSAITRLRQVYKEDSDRGVRDAAEYSLGMFRALERALDSDVSEAVMEQLEDIAVNKAFGRRARLRASNLYRLSLGLLVSLAMLLVFNFVLWPRLAPQLGTLGIAASGNGASATAPAALRTYVANLKADATTLQQQYQNVLGGGQVNCDAAFTVSTPLAAGDVPAQFASVVDRSNTVLTALNSAKTPYLQACPPNNTPLTAADIGAPLGSLRPILQTEIPAIEAAVGVGDSVAATPTVEQAVATPVEPSLPAPSATPAYDVTPHVEALNSLITRMEGTGGPNAVLTQYWADVRATGATGGCGQARPTIPADYALPEADVAQAPERLTFAIGLVNTGLELVRRSWDQFAQACSSRALGASLDTGTRTSSAASDSFNLAASELQTLVAAG